MKNRKAGFKLIDLSPHLGCSELYWTSLRKRKRDFQISSTGQSWLEMETFCIKNLHYDGQTPGRPRAYANTFIEGKRLQCRSEPKVAWFPFKHTAREKEAASYYHFQKPCSQHLTLWLFKKGPSYNPPINRPPCPINTQWVQDPYNPLSGHTHVTKFPVLSNWDDTETAMVGFRSGERGDILFFVFFSGG